MEQRVSDCSVPNIVCGFTHLVPHRMKLTNSQIENHDPVKARMAVYRAPCPLLDQAQSVCLAAIDYIDETRKRNGDVCFVGKEDDIRHIRRWFTLMYHAEEVGGDQAWVWKRKKVDWFVSRLDALLKFNEQHVMHLGNKRPRTEG